MYFSQDSTTEASQAAHRKGIELKAVSVEDENLPPDTKQIIAITGNPSVFIIIFFLFFLLNYYQISRIK